MTGTSIVLDPSREVTLYLRLNRNARAQTLNVVDQSGNPVIVNTKTWVINIKEKYKSLTNLIQLTNGAGFSVGTSSFTINPTAAQLANAIERTYYWEIYNTTDAQTWFCGDCIFHGGKFDDFSSNNQSIVITQSGVSQADLDLKLDKSKNFLEYACSDETTALTAGTAKITFRMPYAMTVTAVRASLVTAQTSGTIFTVDIKKNGVSILSTKLTIDNTEKTSTTAATPAVISDTALTDDAEITIDIFQIGDGTAKGLKVKIYGS